MNSYLLFGGELKDDPPKLGYHAFIKACDDFEEAIELAEDFLTGNPPAWVHIVHDHKIVWERTS